ncbi:hypothetical protein B0H13DRAFT_2373735 [Mycena leptocephala]|nr:hypothetical protein B0H13DRAFT_2373735 [Mycena leptocephala]
MSVFNLHSPPTGQAGEINNKLYHTVKLWAAQENDSGLMFRGPLATPTSPATTTTTATTDTLKVVEPRHRDFQAAPLPSIARPARPLQVTLHRPAPSAASSSASHSTTASYTTNTSNPTSTSSASG